MKRVYLTKKANTYEHFHASCPVELGQAIRPIRNNFARMKSIVNKSTFLSLFLLQLLCVSSAFAQDNKEYLAEIGVQAGLNIYAGDVNTIANKQTFANNLKNMQPDLGAFFRYKFSNRFAVRVGYDYGSVQGNYTYLINNQANSIQLNNKGINQFDLWGEYNFFELENNSYKLHSKKFSPFIFAGIGYFQMPNSQAERSTAVNIPFGFGMKVKMSSRWNLDLKWINHLLLSDNLEGLKSLDNPIPRTTSNFLNNDLLSGLTIGISFNFLEKGCDCNNNGSNLFRRSNYSKPLNNTKPRK